MDRSKCYRFPPMPAWRTGVPALVVGLVLAGCGGGGDEAPITSSSGPSKSAQALGAGSSCANRVNNNFDKLLECVTLEGVRAHQAALQTIADNNGGTRAAGTPGYDASVSYIVEKLTAAGYAVTLNPFSFSFQRLPTLQQIAPSLVTYATGAFTGTGYGTVTASVTAVDINLVPPRASTSGCEAADFAGFPVGNIALIQRGTCPFATKALNAQAAGASAVIIFNQGDTTEREALRKR